MKQLRHALIAIIAVTLVLVLTACPNPTAGDNGDNGDGGPGDDETETITVDLGDATAEIVTPVEVTVSEVTDTSGYPSDAATGLLRIEGDLPSGETATLSFTPDTEPAGTEEIVRAATDADGVATGQSAGGPTGQWEEVGTSTISDDGTISIEVSDVNGVWAVVAAPAPPEVTSDSQESPTREPTWSWDPGSTPADAPEPARYRYRLAGEEWTETEDDGTRSFTATEKLPLGPHTFEVQAGTDTGVWSNAGSAEYVVLHPEYYFNLEPGFGVEYEVQDDLTIDGGDVNGGNAFTSWMVNQVDMTPDGQELGIITFTPDSDFKNGPESALLFSRLLVIDDVEYWGFQGGMPSRSTANFVWVSTVVPSNLTDGTTTTSPVYGIEYTYTYAGSQTIGGEDFDDTLRIEVSIPQSVAENMPGDIPSFWQGSGHVILAPGVGMVELVYNRDNGEDLSIRYQSHGTQPQNTLRGTLLDSGGDPAEGYQVELDAITGEDDPLPGDTTDEDGRFELEVYGPRAYLFIGEEDPEADGELDTLLEHYVEDPTAEITVP